MKKFVLILALLGDPTIPAGIPHAGGFNQTLRELITALAALELPICIVTDASVYRSETRCQLSQNIKLLRVPVTELERNAQENLKMAQDRILNDIYFALGEQMNDVALVHSFYWFSGHLAQRIKMQYNIPYIHTPISLSYDKISTGCKPNCQFQVECEPVFLQNADLILAITEQEAQTLVQYYRVSRSHIVITGRSVDQVFHEPSRNYSGQPRGTTVTTKYAPINDGAPWWVSGAYTYIGRIVPIKGVSEIVLAWEQLYQKHGKHTPALWLVGGTPTQIAAFRTGILQQTSHLPFYESIQKIVWWGYLDQASISALLLKTLVLVTHSRFEAGGRVILEAMCQGRPVIATPHGFAADFIRDWNNGFLIPYGDRALLTHRMEHFIYQPFLAAAMGAVAKKSFQRIEKDWNYVGIHERLYRSYLYSQPECVDSRNGMPSIAPFDNSPAEEVNVFPYRDIRFEKAEWIAELTAGLRQSITRFTSIKSASSHARHFAAETKDERFRIKQFYNRMSEEPVWRIGVGMQVLEQTTQYCAAMQSQHFHGIVPAVFSCQEGAYYVLPELQQAHPDYAALCSLLNTLRQKNTCVQPESPLIQRDSSETLEQAIDAMVCSTQASQIGKSRELLEHLPMIRRLLNRSHSDAQFGINYGKPLSGHIFYSDETLCLLPTSSWYWGELGSDDISAAILSGLSPIEFWQQQHAVRMLLWYLFTCWKNLLRAEWLNYNSPQHWVDMMHETLTLLKQL